MIDWNKRLNSVRQDAVYSWLFPESSAIYPQNGIYRFSQVCNVQQKEPKKTKGKENNSTKLASTADK